MTFCTFIRLCNVYLYLVSKHFHHPNEVGTNYHSAFLEAIIYFPSLWFCLFLVFHTNGITYYMTFFFAYLTSLAPLLSPLLSSQPNMHYIESLCESNEIMIVKYRI
jgi:hypothetical protein